MNKDNNLRYVEQLRATNPCGEQPLPAYGCCDLGPIILTKFVKDAFSPHACFDFEAFKQAVGIQVRFLDNVLDVTHWPLEEQKCEAQNKRRIGVGFTALGDTLIMLGISYASNEGRAMAASIAKTMRDYAYGASIELAKEKGAFPLFDADKYLEAGTFASRLPKAIQEEIRKHGIRNSHLLSIAPTGTVSLAFADNASNGIEPAFAWSYNRKKRMPDGSYQTYPVLDHAFRVYAATKLPQGMGDAIVKALGEAPFGSPPGKVEFSFEGKTLTVEKALPRYFIAALDMSAMDHLLMMAAVQPFVDTAISKTVNVPVDYPYEAFKDLYLEAWKAGLKGLATFRPNNIIGSVLSVGSDAPAKKAEPQDDNPLHKQFANRPEGDLEALSTKVAYWTQEGAKSVYLTVSFMRVSGVVGGKPVTIERPVEFFLPSNQAGEGQQWISSNMRMLSMVARSGGPVTKALANMREIAWDKGPVRCGTVERADGAKVPRFHNSEVAAIGYALQALLIKRGFLDANGNQVPVEKLAERLAKRDSEFGFTLEGVAPGPIDPPKPVMTGGKECGECGAHAVRKADGCEKCDNCGALGSCG